MGFKPIAMVYRLCHAELVSAPHIQVPCIYEFPKQIRDD